MTFLEASNESLKVVLANTERLLDRPLARADCNLLKPDLKLKTTRKEILK